MKKLSLSLLLIISSVATSSGLVLADELPFTLSGHARVNYGHQDWLIPDFRDGFEFESFKLGVAGESDQFSYKAEYRWYENVAVSYTHLTLPTNREV